MKKATAFFMVLVLCVSMAACGSSYAEQEEIESEATEVSISLRGSGETEAEATEARVSLNDSIDAILQGSWSFHDEETGFNEIFSFNNGDFTYKTYLDNISGSGSENSGSYEIGDGCIRLVFKNGFVNDIAYEVSGADLILFKYIDSGADAGTTRMYEKDHGYGNIPDSGSSQGTPNRENPKDTPETGNITAGMRNALKEARNYLSVMPFSYEGLIEQLEYEGYSHSEAVYAADNCGADWYEQAVRAARNYLDIMAFSRSGLIEQLEYEGYTHEQAVYGVDKAY